MIKTGTILEINILLNMVSPGDGLFSRFKHCNYYLAVQRCDSPAADLSKTTE